MIGDVVNFLENVVDGKIAADEYRANIDNIRNCGHLNILDDIRVHVEFDMRMAKISKHNFAATLQLIECLKVAAADRDFAKLPKNNIFAASYSALFFAKYMGWAIYFRARKLLRSMYIS